MLADAIGMGFNATSTGVNQTFFQTIESDWTNMAHLGVLNSFVQKGIDHWTQYDRFMSELAEIVYNRPMLTKRSMKIVNFWCAKRFYDRARRKTCTSRPRKGLIVEKVRQWWPGRTQIHSSVYEIIEKAKNSPQESNNINGTVSYAFSKQIGSRNGI